MTNPEDFPLEINLNDYEPIQRMVIEMMINTGVKEEEDRVIAVLSDLWESYEKENNVKAMFIIEEIQEGLGYA